MFHPSFGLILVFSQLYNTCISSGQPLPPDRQARVHEARMEQRILSDIRSFVMQTCSTDYKPGILSSKIQNLTTRIVAIEKLLLSQRRRECTALFGSLESNPVVDVFEDQCYYFGQENVTWIEAQEKCQSVGANLVTVPTSELIYFLSVSPHFHGAPFWIGLRWSDRNWKWVTDGEVVEEKATQWGVGQPNGRSSNLCVVVSTKVKKWYDRICKRTFYFVCELGLS
ncbi:lithostathine-1-alpha-like [Pecten maximus]|uniref:lithostathine-1-alpha-like n=1 Tax=Pecten maximus TaxID=6579 RepID=UPI0014581F88|nr:lithostathine-1-alpha-like [Pecten maximus]